MIRKLNIVSLSAQTRINRHLCETKRYERPIARNKAMLTCPTPSSGEAAPAAKDTDRVRDLDHPRCNTRMQADAMPLRYTHNRMCMPTSG